MRYYFDDFEIIALQERQSLLHCLSDTNRSMSRLMTEKDKLAERLSRTRDEHAKSSIAYVNFQCYCSIHSL